MSTTRKRAIALGASAVVGVLVLVAIFAFGVRDIPGYPSLADAPDPTITGWIAYGVYDERGSNQCIDVVLAGGGAPRRITCNAGGPFGWSPDGQLQVYTTPLTTPPYSVTRYDPVTGTGQASSTTSPPAYPTFGSPRRADGAMLNVSPNRVTVGSSTGIVTILETKNAPEDFEYRTARWSPDGRWVLVLDSEQRLLLVGGDGTGPTRVVAKGVGFSFDWWQPAK